jgi:hypothetical protein
VALTACRECGAEVSDLAAACPKCGAPRTAAPQSFKPNKPLGAGSWLLMIAALAGGVWVGVRGFNSAAPDTKPESPGARSAFVRIVQGAPGVRFVDWNSATLRVVVDADGSNYTRAADRTCASAREHGVTGALRVQYLDGAAFLNGRSVELAAVPCG